MSASSKHSPSARRLLAAMSILIVGLVVSARLIFGSAIPFLAETPTVNRVDPRTTLAALEPAPAGSGGHATKPIDALRVGDRVLAANPEITDLERSTWQEPRWDQWIHLSLKMPLPAKPPVSDLGDAKGTPVLNVELLRPEQWFVEHVGFVVRPRDGSSRPAKIRTLVDFEPNADRKRVAHSPLRPAFRHLLAIETELDSREMDLVGLSVELDLPEMGAVGTAYVTSIEPSVSVQPGDGQVVTATFSHPPSSAVLDVHFQDGSAPVGVTDNHPFWSVDRQRFVPIGEMEIGERVVTFHGETKRIESKLPRPGPQWVYNLEVYGEHVYFVGEQGLLVHNSYQSKADRVRNKSQMDLLRDEAFSVLKSARRHVEKEMRRDPRFSGLLKAARGGDNQASMIYGFILDAKVKKTLQLPGANTGITRISGLVFSSGGSRLGSVVKPGGSFGVKGQYRLPDFTFTKGGVTEFWDLKGPGFNRATSRQFDDILNWTGVEPIALRYNR
nr:polymorphic toxin-type HINT domain-containing protein [Rhodopirellula sp. SM50]